VATITEWQSAIDGLSPTGRPHALHAESCQALFAVAGRLLGLAAQAGAPFAMPMLEGRWWVEDDRPPLRVPREEWRWHLFLRLPDRVEAPWADQARESARGAEAVDRVQLVTFTEGTCVQAMHHGPYADEPVTLARMNDLMDAVGLVPNGLHHEIYLSDVRETRPSG
jgi:hypothetical protein